VCRIPAVAAVISTGLLAGPRSRAGLRRELGLPAEEADAWLLFDMVPPSLHRLLIPVSDQIHRRRGAAPVRPRTRHTTRE